YNAYGPTECSVCVSIYKVTPEDIKRSRIPIGKPIANTKVFILNDDLKLVAAGVYGEMYVAGVGLAKGYLGLPALTEEKFINSPFATGETLYKTGDTGRWLPDGNIEFSGRRDDQIKIRGFRVELGEIENTLVKHKDVEKTVVVVNDSKEDKQLVLYFQPKDKIKLWPSVAEFYVYDDLLYKTMAGDEARNAKYRNALRKVVKDKVVLEIGPGFEAILSRICIEEGAKKVYAVELLEDSYLKAKQIVEDLGLEDKIIVIHDDITKVQLPEKVDLCVSEIVGAIGGSEGSATLINASRHLLKDPSAMIPKRSLTKIAAITLPKEEFDCGFEQLGAYYTSKIFEQAGRKFDLRVYLSSFPTRNIISNEGVFEDLDYTRESKLEDEHKIRLQIEQDSILNGFIVWLNLYPDEEELIDTVNGTYTWLPIYFPAFFDGEKVAEGDYIEAKVIRKLSSNNLNPDFIVEGVLFRKDKAELPFTYESLYISKTYKGNSFYEKIFENDEIKIVDKVNKDELRDFLKSKLPDYMVPSLFIEIESFPLNISGKIDKKALPSPNAGEILEEQYVAPRTQTEKDLVEIWKDVLELEQVGVRDDFFELGGHSLLAIRLISVIREVLHVEVAIASIFDHPTIETLAAKLESEIETAILPVIELQERPERIPLSFSQERLWFIDQLEGSLEYNTPAALRLSGYLDVSALEQSLGAIIDRHEVLRTVIREYAGTPYQYIKDKGDWHLETVEGNNYKNDIDELNKYIKKLASKPFDLSKDYMLRAELISLAKDKYVLVVVMHHIASDAWSMPIIIKELAELYNSFIENRNPRLLPLELQYADYAIWQRNYLTPEVLGNKINYWKEKLDGLTPLALPTDYKRPAVRSTTGAAAHFRVDKEIVNHLHKLSQQESATLFMTLLAAYKVLLYRYSGQEDISVGTSIANRTQKEVEGLIGFFVNTLTFRDEVKGESSFTELLQQVKATTLGAYEHQEVPFEKVVETVVKERDAGGNPLFQVMLVLQNTPDAPGLQLGGLTLSSENYEHTVSKFDLTFFVNESSEGLQCMVQYRTDLFKTETIERMMSHFQQLLASIVQAPQQKVGLLPMLTLQEQKTLFSFNNPKIAYSHKATIVSLFESQVQKTPQATAVVFEDEQLTYEQLNAKANQLAHYLRQRGVKEDSLVPVYIERSINLLTAILGILKAGAAYVPIDTDFPGDRISYMLKDSGSPIVISSKAGRSKLETAEPDTDIIDIESTIISGQPTTNPQTALQANHLAYVIYTSGSTGKPKGVMIEHRNLVDYVFGLNDKLHIDQCSSYALVSSIATDLG
ncbi:MAG TPA: condensation domain-containing protein, partial [Segetibacter sp.]